MTVLAQLPARLRLPTSGLAMLLDARYPAGYSGGRFPQADNTALASWSDLGPNGWTATQATAAKQPTWFQEGRVRFDGVDDALLTASGLPVLRNAAAATVYLYVNLDSGTSTADRAMFWVTNNGTAGSRFIVRRSGTGGKYITLTKRLDADTTLITDTGVGVDGAGWKVLSATLDYAGNALTLYVDNAQAATGAWAAAGNTSDTNAAGPVVVGAGRDGAQEFMPGSIRAVVLYSAVHDAQTRARVAEALRRGWGPV